MNSEMYSPVERAKDIQKIVLKDATRKYYRLSRPGRWYGGIATADCVGCQLRCVFCWSGEPRDHPDQIGKFYKPEEVFQALDRLAKKRGYSQLRVSGNEPTLGEEHLLKLLELIEKTDYRFVLETNGLLINEEYAKNLKKFKNLHVRVSLKGTNPEEFSHLTSAKSEFFDFQLNALRNLIEAGVSCHPAVMLSFCPKENFRKLKEEIRKISPKLAEEIEEEYVILYPLVIKRLKEAGIKPLVAYDPSGVPKELI